MARKFVLLAAFAKSAGAFGDGGLGDLSSRTRNKPKPPAVNPLAEDSLASRTRKPKKSAPAEKPFVNELASRTRNPKKAVDASLDSPLTTMPSRARNVVTKRAGVAAVAAAGGLNGWTPSARKFAWGLPGALAPAGDFDPLGLCPSELGEVVRYREAEVMHGRVAMVAAVGYLAGEAASPVVWDGAIAGPANDQLAMVPGPLFGVLTLAIGVAETYRAKLGWVEPGADGVFALRDAYYPGDLGFDPAGLKPEGAAEFADMATKELQHGRLAMIGVAGMCAQELVNHKTIADTLDLYLGSS